MHPNGNIKNLTESNKKRKSEAWLLKRKMLEIIGMNGGQRKYLTKNVFDDADPYSVQAAFQTRTLWMA